MVRLWSARAPLAVLSRRFSSSLTRASQPVDAQVARAGPAKPWCLVYGGGGSLGQSVIDTFNSHGFRTISADRNANSRATHSLTLDRSLSFKASVEHAKQQLHEIRAHGEDDPAAFGLSSVVVTAGGWCGGPVSSSNLFDCFDSMIEANARASLAAAALFATFALPSSLLLFTGAMAASQRSGTPGMVAYGMAKASVHHLTLSLAASDSELTKKGNTVACLLPLTLDTPTNRQFMADADFADWTPTSVISEHAVKWTREAMRRGATHSVARIDSDSSLPRLQHGGFYAFTTSHGVTTVRLIDEPLALDASIVAQ